MTDVDVVVRPNEDGHVLVHADSLLCRYEQGFDLVLTSPPFYHPTRRTSPHGLGFTGDLDAYARFVADVVVRCADSVRGKRVCILKTDVWHRGALLPLGFKIADACSAKGLRLRAHWVWRRMKGFSRYAPSFANVFVMGDGFSRPHVSGLFTETPSKRRQGMPSSFVPEIFGVLMDLLVPLGGVVLDPFAGVGGVLEAAAGHGRRSVGIEVSDIQIRRAGRRLAAIPGFVVRRG